MLEEDLTQGKSKVLVVFDAAAYGGYYALLKEIIKDCEQEIRILSWDSFECYLLSSPYFNKQQRREICLGTTIP